MNLCRGNSDTVVQIAEKTGLAGPIGPTVTGFRQKYGNTYCEG
jgi:hypothetical protein